MASRRAPQAIRSSLSQVAKYSTSNGARFSPALLTRASASTVKPAVTISMQQTRGKKTVDFAGVKEVVHGWLSSIN
jgi:ketol-acid reductoisomerase